MRLGLRLRVACGGCVKSKAGPPAGSPRQGEGRFACRLPVGNWSALVLAPLPHRRLTEPDRAGGVKPDHTLLWCCPGRLHPATPARLATPADAPREPEH